MQVPESVRIGAQTYCVLRSPMVGERDCFGSYSARLLQIELDSNSAESRQQQTLLHEMIEAACFEYHIEIKHGQIEQLEEIKHGQIEQLEVALFQMLTDNPGLFAPQENGDG